MRSPVSRPWNWRRCGTAAPCDDGPCYLAPRTRYAFTRSPAAAAHGPPGRDAGGRPGRQGAVHRTLVGRRFHDPLPGLSDGDERPAEIRDGRQVGELAEYVGEEVKAVADGDREQVGPVCLV